MCGSRQNKMAVLWLLLTSLIVIASGENKDGGKAPRIPLNDGNSIPALGLGTFLGFDEKGQKEVKDKEVEDPVTWALDSGYRLFDTAEVYKNEEQIGAAVRASTVPREDIFIVTKLAHNRQREVVQALRDSLKRLNMSYVDLFLIHNPVAFKSDGSGYDIIDYLDTWKAMEETKQLGLAKSIGLSNFNISQIERVLANSQIKPAVLQVEANINLGQDRLLEFCKNHNIVMMAYTPFGSMFSPMYGIPPKIDDPTLVALAGKYQKTVPQVVLRYLVQRGLVPIPKSVRKEKIEENIAIFDFELTPEEMVTLSKFNKEHRSVYWPIKWQNHPYFPFERRNPSADVFEPNI